MGDTCDAACAERGRWPREFPRRGGSRGSELRLGCEARRVSWSIVAGQVVRTWRECVWLKRPRGWISLHLCRLGCKLISVQKSCVVACDLPSLLLPFSREGSWACASGWDEWYGDRDHRSKLAREPIRDQELGRDRWRGEFGLSGMWSTCGGARPEFTTHVTFRCMTEEEGQATSTREEARRRRRHVGHRDDRGHGRER